jgi:hypothetical protein
MSESKKRSIAMVMGAMLVGILVGGVIWARPDQRAQAADSTRRVTVPAAFFHPNDEGLDYLNNGNYVEIESGQGIFTAPVVFPCLPSVTVERIILSVRDQNGTGIGNACIINYTDDTIDYPVVWPSQGPYLWLEIYGTNIEVYGVRIEYKRNI